jgi:hypothetical protein
VALQVHGDHGVPLLLGHVDEHTVAQDAGVVHEDVEVAERLDGGVDQALAAFPVGHVVAVGDGLAAHALDLGHDLLGRRETATRAVGGAPEVVHDDLGALGGEEEGVLTADAAPRPRDDGDPAVRVLPCEPPLAH